MMEKAVESLTESGTGSGGSEGQVACLYSKQL